MLKEGLKNFHFQELEWVIGFPDCGNSGRKYIDYSVIFTDKKSKTKAHVHLGEVVNSPNFEKNMPHTVGFFKQSALEGQNCEYAYLELRLIRSVEEFWKFLNDLDL